jgi:hypothetical protein
MEGKRNKLKTGIFSAFMLLFMLGAAFAQTENPVAVVYRINGALEFRKSSSENWKPAKAQDPLYNGTQLRTGTGDKAIIIYSGTGSGGNRVLINENTILEVQAEMVSPGGKPKVERTKLMAGEIFSQIKKGNKYEVETPSSVASVRGTQFDALFKDDNATFVGMEGVIEVMNELGQVVIGQYQMTNVQAGSAPGSAQDIARKEAEKLIKWTGNVEPTWKLNIAPENGNEYPVGNGFTLTITAVKFTDKAVDNNANFDLTQFGGDSGALEFSVDNGKTWVSEAPQVHIVNGQATVKARIKEEATVNIIAKAIDTEGGLVTVTAKKIKETKKLELKFTNPDGSEVKILQIDLEEK